MELAIGTSSGALSVALIDGAALLAEHHAVIGRGHAETIVEIIAGVVGDRGGAVRGIVVDVGPGSFTGVRIGIAAARALALAWDVPVAGVGSLALVAAAAFADHPGGTVVALADAGRGRVYRQQFTRGGTAADAAQVVAADAVVVPAGAVVAGTGPVRVAGRDVVAIHPRAADARRIDRAGRCPPLPIYLGAEPAVAA